MADPATIAVNEPRRADVFAVFGITGDLAKVMTIDMEFAAEGGEGPTPYEVLLHAAMVGRTLRFTRQDAIAETWRVMQPLLDSRPPVNQYAPGSWGPKAGDELVSGHGRWHGPWIGQ